MPLPEATSTPRRSRGTTPPRLAHTMVSTTRPATPSRHTRLSLVSGHALEGQWAARGRTGRVAPGGARGPKHS